MALFDDFLSKQAELVAEWMRVGYLEGIHNPNYKYSHDLLSGLREITSAVLIGVISALNPPGMCTET